MKNKQNGFALSLLIIIVSLLVVGGGVFVYLNKSEQTEGDNNSLDNLNKNQPQIENNMAVIYDGEKYDFVNSQCNIIGTAQKNGPTIWEMSIELSADTTKLFHESGVVFHVQSSANNIESYLQKGINIATRGVSIENQWLGCNVGENNEKCGSATTEFYKGISFVWDNLSQDNNVFFGDGYIELKNDIKPHEDICNGKKTVNQQYITSSDPIYKTLCPSSVFSAQKIYFKCSSINIEDNPTPLIY
jgi:hypothetical protein